MTADLTRHEMSAATALAFPSIVRNPGILIADDMGCILTLLKFELEPLGFNVWLAVDGNDALDLYQQHRDEIDLVLLDVQMPGLDGVQTLAHIQRLDPDVIACFMTGNAGIYTNQELLERGAACVFAKPFQAANVAVHLKRLASAGDYPPVVCDWQTFSESVPG
jgi:two-component system cell cycle sensor histidine kinase/response regulator CckA